VEKKTVWFSLFRKVVPSEYEEWLESLALDGWNINRIGNFSSLKMTFYKTKPRQYSMFLILMQFQAKTTFIRMNNLAGKRQAKWLAALSGEKHTRMIDQSPFLTGKA
jgi:hypothetical protein